MNLLMRESARHVHWPISKLTFPDDDYDGVLTTVGALSSNGKALPSLPYIADHGSLHSRRSTEKSFRMTDNTSTPLDVT